MTNGRPAAGAERKLSIMTRYGGFHTAQQADINSSKPIYNSGGDHTARQSGGAAAERLTSPVL